MILSGMVRDVPTCQGKINGCGKWGGGMFPLTPMHKRNSAVYIHYNYSYIKVILPRGSFRARECVVKLSGSENIILSLHKHMKNGTSTFSS